jgi:hypothetical protein
MSIRVSLRCSRVDLAPFESILPAGHGGASITAPPGNRPRRPSRAAPMWEIGRQWRNNPRNDPDPATDE